MEVGVFYLLVEIEGIFCVKTAIPDIFPYPFKQIGKN